MKRRPNGAQPGYQRITEPGTLEETLGSSHPTPQVRSGCVRGPEMPPSRQPRYLCRAAPHRSRSAGSHPPVPGPRALVLPDPRGSPRAPRRPGPGAVGGGAGPGAERGGTAGGGAAPLAAPALGGGRARGEHGSGSRREVRGRGCRGGAAGLGTGVRPSPSRCPRPCPGFSSPLPQRRCRGGALRAPGVPRCRSGVGLLPPPGPGWSRGTGRGGVTRGSHLCPARRGFAPPQLAALPARVGAARGRGFVGAGFVGT